MSSNAEATSFWLSEAQQAVLANEYGADASPAFCGGDRSVRTTRRAASHASSSTCLHAVLPQHDHQMRAQSCPLLSHTPPAAVKTFVSAG